MCYKLRSENLNIYAQRKNKLFLFKIVKVDISISTSYTLLNSTLIVKTGHMSHDIEAVTIF